MAAIIVGIKEKDDSKNPEKIYFWNGECFSCSDNGIKVYKKSDQATNIAAKMNEEKELYGEEKFSIIKSLTVSNRHYQSQVPR